jgi:Lon protease-like protein
MSQLPIFPLPVVLLPGSPMPLHIFEPRYRQLVAHCIEADKRFGLVYHDPDESGPFRVEGQVACVAEIREFQPIPDGRSMIVVEGRERVRLEDEVGSEDAMYYRADAVDFDDLVPDPPGIVERRRASIDLFHQVVTHVGEDPAKVPEIDATRDVSFALARWIRTPPQWRQHLLESQSETERLDQLDELFRMALETVE